MIETPAEFSWHPAARPDGRPHNEATVFAEFVKYCASRSQALKTGVVPVGIGITESRTKKVIIRYPLSLN